MGRFKSNLGVE